MNEELLKILDEGLTRHGYDGLFNPGVCACKIGELVPCEEMGDDCEPGVFVVLPGGTCDECTIDKPCDFHIGPKSASAGEGEG